MTALAIALLAALLASNAAWFRYSLRRDTKLLDALSEMATRVQHPTLVNPRMAQDPPPEPDWTPDELNEMELAGTVQYDGIRRDD